MNYLMAHNLAAWQQIGGFVPGTGPIVDRTRERSITDKDDTFIDKKTGQLSWKAQRKHFVVEDDNCGVYLVKNALGGSRRGLFETVMSLRPPLAQRIRGDFTVAVTFFDDEVTLPKAR
jgi:pyruvate dehydrogenase phosphatase